jgi:aspartyl-tRNA(Asn)/glutamyl-tRNA(Gln) amidotransferase subunit A
MNDLEICRMSALQMAEAIKDKKLSPVEILEAVLNRIEKLNPKINAYCTVVAESARQQAKHAEATVMKGDSLGPLHGIPVSIKDLIYTKGIRTTGGSVIYENFVPEEDAIDVARLKAAGAIVVGKTNTPEFGCKGTTDNLLFGKTRNPWNLERTPGGSSGGAAAAVSSCIEPIALGSDGGGSIRVPGSFCGIFGFKPSFGRVPRFPGFPGWETISHHGPLTRTVQDAALVMEIIAGRDDRDHYSLPDTSLSYLPFLEGDLKGLKVAWSQNLGYAVMDSEVLAITEAAARTFENLGAIVEEAIPDFTFPEMAFSATIGIRMATVLEGKWEQRRDRMDRGLVRFIEVNKDKSAIDLARAEFELLDYHIRLMSFLQDYDLVLTPTFATPPFDVNSYGPKAVVERSVTPLNPSITMPFNVTGQPAASVPCGYTADGLPVGLQIAGRRFDDGAVLRAAAAFERAAPWLDKLPPLE